MSTPRKVRCTVTAITDHGGRVYTVDLKPESPLPSFRPGHFLHLTVDHYDPSSFWPESRVFSIASSPRDVTRLRICYAVKGAYTTRMEQVLAVGGTVWVKLPYGDFVIDDSHASVLIAGGTGISAFTAFIEALKPGHAKPVWLIYGARNSQLLLFEEMLVEQMRSVPDFQIQFFVETPDVAFFQKMAVLPKAPECLHSAIRLDKVWPRLTARDRAIFYLAGPPGMQTALTADLNQRGIAPECIRTDAWE